MTHRHKVSVIVIFVKPGKQLLSTTGMPIVVAFDLLADPGRGGQHRKSMIATLIRSASRDKRALERFLSNVGQPSLTLFGSSGQRARRRAGRRGVNDEGGSGRQNERSIYSTSEVVADAAVEEPARPTFPRLHLLQHDRIGTDRRSDRQCL